ncbi:hypothetical protein RUM44_001225 [Polyplax serrata]|uniref:Uncharacterized protein n=1 Tax=Polyplax serrata TaxID=468196 RepID=A0ABR1AJD9_POLSC
MGAFDRLTKRKPLKGLTKKYKTPPQRRRKKKDVEEEEDDNEDEEEDEADGEKIIGNRRLQSNDTHLLFNQWTKGCSNGNSKIKANKGVTASSTFLSGEDVNLTGHRILPKNYKSGHEVVTTTHRMQESCI